MKMRGLLTNIAVVPRLIDLLKIPSLERRNANGIIAHSPLYMKLLYIFFCFVIQLTRSGDTGPFTPNLKYR